MKAKVKLLFRFAKIKLKLLAIELDLWYLPEPEYTPVIVKRVEEIERNITNAKYAYEIQACSDAIKVWLYPFADIADAEIKRLNRLVECKGRAIKLAAIRKERIAIGEQIISSAFKPTV